MIENKAWKKTNKKAKSNTLPTKFKCEKVWKNYGIFKAIVPFVGIDYWICLQQLNRFCYDIAVSRV